MFLRDDFIVQENHTRRLYHCFCDVCSKDRGYQRIDRAKQPYCRACASSITHKNKIVSAETRQKMSKNNWLNNGGVNPRLNKHHTLEARTLLSQRQKEHCRVHGNQFVTGKSQGKHSVESINEMSRKNSGREPQWKGRTFVYSGPQGNMKLRSSYELFYAYWLDQKGIKWQYEPQFRLSDGKIFSPDFRLDTGVIIEVKGYFSEKGRTKWALFCRDYPLINKMILFKNDLIKLGMKEI